MLDNDPLDHGYRWHDIVEVRKGEVGKVLFRPFPHWLGFRWVPEVVEADDLITRQALKTAASQWGKDVNLTFFCPGMGFVLYRQEAVLDALVQAIVGCTTCLLDVVYLPEDRTAPLKVLFERASVEA